DGTLVYNTSDATRPGCGKIRNQGAVCVPGDYVWMVDVEGANRSTETFTGTVKLLPYSSSQPRAASRGSSALHRHGHALACPTSAGQCAMRPRTYRFAFCPSFFRAISCSILFPGFIG